MRFYFQKPYAKVDEMSPATRDSWMACDRAMNRFDEAELPVLKSYFTAKWRKEKPSPNIVLTAEKHGLTVTETQELIDKALKTVAIERGLADE